jgi:hypothetical protein
MMRKLRNFFPILLAAGVLGACDDSSTGDDTGRLTIRMTDGPGDLTSAFVKVSKFVLIGASGDTTASGRVEITPTSTGYIDLLTLTGGTVMDMVSADVPEGTYSELRVVLTDAYVKLKDGRVFATSGATLPAGTTSAGTLKCPSCAQSGFKVKFSNGGLTVGNNTTVTIDFDVAQSFGHEAGASGQWILHPVLKAMTTTVATGRITGNVTLATGVTVPTCGGQANTITLFKPTAILAGDTVSGTTTAAGVYNIASVPVGTYTLNNLRDVTYTNGDSLTFTATPSVATVTVAQGDSARANYTVSAAVCH